MKLSLDASCVYTIATRERITEAANSGTPLYESKRWISAAAINRDAIKSGTKLPVLFADARNCSVLLGWSTVSSITITDSGTHYTIGTLWKLPARMRPQNLQVLNSGNYIAEGHIRPYVLCRTPSFLFNAAKDPKSWVPDNADIIEVQEGRRRLVEHMRRERKPALVVALKKQWLEKNNGRLPCQVCGFDFLETYGPLGAGFAEAHHKEFLADAPDEGRSSSLRDFAVVCANCHRMLHQSPEYPTIEALRGRVRHACQKKLRKDQENRSFRTDLPM